MKIFSFLKKHKMNLLIALLLLMVQANCELSLPTVMSSIVDTGISNSGIESAVPDVISRQRLDDVKLFLTDGEAARLDAVLEPDGDLVRFAGSSDDRADLEGPISEAEMLAYQFEQGIPVGDLVESGAMGDPSMAGRVKAALGDTVDTEALKKAVSSGMVDRFALVEARRGLADKLGDGGQTVIKARAVEFVKSAYKDAGVDVSSVQSDFLFREGGRMLGYAAIASLCAILAAFNASYTAAGIARDLRHDLYERVLSFSPAETSKFSAASLITRGTNDIQQVQMVLTMCMRIVLFAPCMGVGAIWRVLTFGSTGLQWIIVASIVAIAAVVGILMGLTMPRFRIMQKLVDRNNLVAREILTGIMPIRAFGRSRYEEGRYDEANRDLTRTYIFTNRAMAFMMPVMMLIMNVTSIAIVWFGGHGIDAGSMQVGDLMAYMNYTIQVIMSFMMITMIAVMLPRADVAAERVSEVLSTRSSIKDPAAERPDECKMVPASGSWQGNVTFDNVSFAYPGSDVPTIKDVSFSAKAGQTLGIIGSTGVGKSTLIQLIPRLYDVTGGRVLVDGIDVRDIGLKQLRSLIGYVPQKGVLFSGTIADTISYAEPTMSQDQIEGAARIAQASDFIDSKPNGYDSAISQGGSNVSGGQRQRLSIARAIAAHPKILIFDDSFSALDYKTDAALRQALAQSVHDSCVIIVAQRIATIMQAEQILVLDDGHPVGLGTHEELLRTCPEYLEIATSQLSPEELGLDGDHAAQDGIVDEGGER